MKFEVDSSKDKEEVGFTEGVCPYCNSQAILYTGPEADDVGIYYEVECQDCGNTFREHYDIKFSAMWGYPLKKKS